MRPAQPLTARGKVSFSKSACFAPFMDLISYLHAILLDACSKGRSHHTRLRGRGRLGPKKGRFVPSPVNDLWVRWAVTPTYTSDTVKNSSGPWVTTTPADLRTTYVWWDGAQQSA